MAQLPISKEYNNFVGGLITEASPLTFPPNASFDEDNMELNKKGYRHRRKGLGYEDQWEPITLTSSEYSSLNRRAISTYVWKNVSGDPELSILVVQYGRGLRFFNYSSVSTSANQLYGGNTLQIEGAVVSIAPLGLDANSQFSFTQINGDLLVAGGDDCVYRVRYNSDTDDMEVEAHGILVRDIWGVDDGLDPTDQTADTLSSGYGEAENSNEHLYNSYNQGWYTRPGDTDADDYNAAYIVRFRQKLPFSVGITAFPSNSQVPFDGYDHETEEYLFLPKNSGSLAPKGKSIIDVFYRGLSREWNLSTKSIINNFGLSEWGEGISGAVGKLLSLGMEPEAGDFNVNIYPTDLPYDWTRSGVYNIASYAGRIFYSGINPKYSNPLFEGDQFSPNIGSFVFYSQLVDNVNKIGKCYQEGDPTQEDTLDLVDTDGGFIVIPEMSTPISMISLANSLIIFAENGIWEITGGQSGFSATNHEVRKITDIGVVGKSSIVKAETSIYFWSEGGIYQLTYDVNSLNFIVQNITERTIQTYYNNISSPGKAFASGVYDPSRKIISWLYNSTDEYNGIDYRFDYNKSLNFDLTLGSFYPFTFYKVDGSLTPLVVGAFITDKASIQSLSDTVTINGETVTIDGEDVIITENARFPITSQIKYLIFRAFSSTGSIHYNFFTFGVLNNNKFIDFEGSFYQRDCPATITTGQELLGDTQRKKQSTYLTVHCERTETGFDANGDSVNQSSCLVTPIWGFSTSSNSGKIGTQFQAYRLNRKYLHTGPIDDFDYGQSVITTKNKLRGRDRSLALRFDTEEEKDMIVYGWAVTYLGNSEV